MAEAQAGAPESPATTTGSDGFALSLHSEPGRERRVPAPSSDRFGSPPGPTAARGKLLNLLEYAPPQCPHRAEVVERTDCGDYFREKLYLDPPPRRTCTSPGHAVPKYAKLPAPGIVALHDHGAFYFWGKEKLVDMEEEHAALTRFKKQYYDGHNTSVLARQGYVVIVIDMFYWGERRMLLDKDPADWRERPKDVASDAVTAFNQRASQRALVSKDCRLHLAGWGSFWTNIRTVDSGRAPGSG